jgi:outer membrane receptor protein involved in Fe transport
LKKAALDLAARYIAADTSSESNLAPTFALKLDFPHGFALRGSLTTSNRFPAPQMSRQVLVASDTPGAGVNRVTITDPLRGAERYPVEQKEAINPNLHSEAAVTQSAGLIFQTGKTHRFRAGIDFVDTQKTNELVYLDPQAVMNLEEILPERVQRASLETGDPHRAGLVQSVLTGTTNLARRQSQNWTASIDYLQTGFMGGSFEAYARLLYFQRYDRRVLPSSPIVDELDKPDGTAPGLLRYRSNFGVSWSNRQFGFGLDGHYFHHRILPQKEQPVQSSDRIGSYTQLNQAAARRWVLSV